MTETVETGFAPINGARVYFEAAGEGELLVLVHAGITDRRMWDGQFHSFARHHRVIRYDRRSFGNTKMVAGPFSHHRDLYELLKFLGIRRAFLLGCSQGGRIVLDFTLEHPEMAAALVVVGSALSGFTFTGENPVQWAQVEEADRRGDVSLVNELELQIWVDGTGRTPEQVDPNIRELVREMNLIALSAPTLPGVEQMLEPAAVHRLSEIRIPTLIIVGEFDVPKMIEIGELLEQNIRGARKIVIRGTAHLPNMEKPEEFNHCVRAFLDALV